MSYTAYCEYLCLPENYELIAGTKFYIHLYYELFKVTAVGTAHGIKLILEVPLKTKSALYSVLDNCLAYTSIKRQLCVISARV
jgi:hypothetical protein